MDQSLLLDIRWQIAQKRTLFVLNCFTKWLRTKCHDWRNAPKMEYFLYSMCTTTMSLVINFIGIFRWIVLGFTFFVNISRHITAALSEPLSGNQTHLSKSFISKPKVFSAVILQGVYKVTNDLKIWAKSMQKYAKYSSLKKAFRKKKE